MEDKIYRIENYFSGISRRDRKIHKYIKKIIDYMEKNNTFSWSGTIHNYFFDIKKTGEKEHLIYPESGSASRLMGEKEE